MQGENLMFENIEYLIKENYISKRKHPEFDLYILNYTAKTQYEEFWNETTESCRGLIVDNSYNIKSRCFRKFFNYEQVLNKVSDLISKKENFEITEKVDGSLGISYWINNKPFIATRGSFNSDQSIKANEIFYKKYEEQFSKLDPSLTYLFEIIYPQNRIVVDYGNKEDLILLGIFETSTNKEISNSEQTIFNAAQKHDIKDCDFNYLKNLNLDNSEGFVVKSSSGFRFKIKFHEYIRIHKLIFGINSRMIWENLKNNQSIDLEKIPDEIYSWVKDKKYDLIKNYEILEKKSKELFDKIKHLDRKTFALNATKSNLSGILFKMFDKKEYETLIWKMIEPELETPFKCKQL